METRMTAESRDASEADWSTRYYQIRETHPIDGPIQWGSARIVYRYEVETLCQMGWKK